MQIKQFTATNIRSLDFVSLTPLDHVNIIIGKNNDGKTTLLESLYFSSSLKSFRSVTSSSLIKNGQNSLNILLNVSKSTENLTISLEKKLKGANFSKINEKRCSAKDLFLSFPVLALNFGAENIVTGSSDERRSLLDWGTFHVEHKYLLVFKDYQKALKQRNSLLKKKSLDNLDYWTTTLAELGETMNAYRERYFHTLNDQFVAYKKNILEIIPDAYDDIKNSALEYYRGWNKKETLYDALNNSLEKDIMLKHTTSGPHRCDMILSSNGYELKNVSAMSTQIITGLLLVLCQSRVFHVEHGHRPIILIDDLFFGIDDKNLTLVINLLKDSSAQCFITAPDLYRSKLDEVCMKDEKIRMYEFEDRKLMERK